MTRGGQRWRTDVVNTKGHKANLGCSGGGRRLLRGNRSDHVLLNCSLIASASSPGRKKRITGSAARGTASASVRQWEMLLCGGGGILLLAGAALTSLSAPSAAHTACRAAQTAGGAPTPSSSRKSRGCRSLSRANGVGRSVSQPRGTPHIPTTSPAQITNPRMGLGKQSSYLLCGFNLHRAGPA